MMCRFGLFFLILNLLSCVSVKQSEISRSYSLEAYQSPKTTNGCFHGFRMLSEALITDENIEQINKLLKNDFYTDEFAKECFEPEYGIHLIGQGQSDMDILVSTTCDRVIVYARGKKSIRILSPLGREQWKLFEKVLFPEAEQRSNSFNDDYDK